MKLDFIKKFRKVSNWRPFGVITQMKLALLPESLHIYCLKLGLLIQVYISLSTHIKSLSSNKKKGVQGSINIPPSTQTKKNLIFIMYKNWLWIVNLTYYGLFKALLPCGCFLYFLFFSLSIHLPSFNIFTYSRNYNSQSTQFSIYSTPKLNITQVPSHNHPTSSIIPLSKYQYQGRNIMPIGIVGQLYVKISFCINVSKENFVQECLSMLSESLNVSSPT